MRETWGKRYLSAVKLELPDALEGQVALISSLAATKLLPRGFRDEFVFGQRDLVVLQNRSLSEKATLIIRATLTPQEGIYVGSTRRGGVVLRRTRSHRYKVLIEAGEVVTLRSLYAEEPRSGVPVRPGFRAPPVEPLSLS